jgi:hypothetical protein
VPVHGASYTILNRSAHVANGVGLVAAVVSALAWQQLDIVSTARFTPQAVVGQALLKSARPLSADDLTKQLVKLTLDTTGNDLFTGALRQWIAAEVDGKREGPPAPGDERLRSGRNRPTLSSP